MAYPTNPNPARVTQEVWEFRCDMLALEAGTNDEDSGIYADKPGYHNTRVGNASDDYSVRDAADKYGPSDKAAAWDWTFRSAQNGDYSRISIYGKRLLTAWEARDPRCNVLREFLGQTDTDSTPEGLDFRYHTKRTPDSSHSWHIHWSFVRAYVNTPGALKGLVSVARGETLEAYYDAGGKVWKIDGTGELVMASQFNEEDKFILRGAPWQYEGNGMPGVPAGWSTLKVLGVIYSTVMLLAQKSNDVTAEELAAIKAAAEAGTMAAVDDIVAAVVAALPEDAVLTKADVEEAMRSVFADAATPDTPTA